MSTHYDYEHFATIRERQARLQQMQDARNITLRRVTITFPLALLLGALSGIGLGYLLAKTLGWLIVTIQLYY